MRIVRQLLTESMLLAFLGGAAGLLLAPVALREIIQMGTVALPRMPEVRMDGAVLFFTMAITLGTGVLFGLPPALHFSPRTHFQHFKDAARRQTPGLPSNPLRHS